MFVCAICHRETASDDVAADLEMGRHFRWCICLACREREIGTAHAVPPRLRRELDEILATARTREPPT
jgi:hypothetical protein